MKNDILLFFKKILSFLQSLDWFSMTYNLQQSNYYYVYKSWYEMVVWFIFVKKTNLILLYETISLTKNYSRFFKHNFQKPVSDSLLRFQKDVFDL